jgi:hypothetical protein
MNEFSKEQQLALVDLFDTVVDQNPVPNKLLADPMVVYRFLFLTKERTQLVFDFVGLLTAEQKSHLTMMDILPEEVMLELHLMHGFDQLTLVQWLRGLDFGDVRFFEVIARDADVLYLDQIMDRARLNVMQVNGIFIESVLAHFKSFDRMVDDAIHKRITFKQFRQLLVRLQPDDDMLKPVIDDLILEHDVLKGITQASQVLPFRVFCSFFDFLSDKKQYLTGVSHVFDQLFVKSTLDKTFLLLNQMPYPIIQMIIERLIAQNTPPIIEHLNQSLVQFKYGKIRKIVRRLSLELNYKV